jgi:hypothetical protein
MDFTITLSKDDWDAVKGGWRCPALQIPGTRVQSIYVDGAAVRAGGSCDGPEEIDADVWFSNWERGGLLLEDARDLAQWDQTIALIWFDDDEVSAPTRERHERARRRKSA